MNKRSVPLCSCYQQCAALPLPTLVPRARWSAAPTLEPSAHSIETASAQKSREPKAALRLSTRKPLNFVRIRNNQSKSPTVALDLLRLAPHLSNLAFCVRRRPMIGIADFELFERVA